MKAKKIILFSKILLVFGLVVGLTHCGSGGSSDEGNVDSTYTVGGTVSELAGSGLVLQNNGSDDLAIFNDGAFVFATPLAGGSDYDVSVNTHPMGPDQSCLVANGSNTISAADVTDVTVTCLTSSLPSGKCTDGSIVYNHNINSAYQSFSQDIMVTGTIPFTCDDSNVISGSGTNTIEVVGQIINGCDTCNWSGSAAMNVVLSGGLSGSFVTVAFNETWYVGSPKASGTCTDCDGDTNPYEYPLLQMLTQHTIEFPAINGYVIEVPASGAGTSGTYSWTLYIN